MDLQHKNNSKIKANSGMTWQNRPADKIELNEIQTVQYNKAHNFKMALVYTDGIFGTFH